MPNLPEIPPFDVALGLISALLLLAAACYLVRSRSSAGLPSLQQQGRKGFSGGDGLFCEFVPDDTARHLSVVGSLFLHVLLVASLPLIELLFPNPLLFDPNHYDVVMLHYQIPERPLTIPSDLLASVTPEKAQPQPKNPLASERDPLGLPEAKAEQTQQAKGPQKGPVINIVAGEREPDNPPLIEIVLPSDAPPDLRQAASKLPSVIIWNLQQEQQETLALIRPKRFEMPLSDTAGNGPPGQQALAKLGLTEAPLLAEQSALPVPTGEFAPSGELWKALDATAGPPTLGMGGAGGGSGSGGLTALALQAALQQGALGRLFGARSGIALGGSGEPVPFRAGAEDGSGSGWGHGELSPIPRKFHGIILVSDSFSTLPEAAGVLTGNPVYTVYVDVPDSPRKWVLQFCVPQDGANPVEFSGEIVRILSRKPLDPPYALRKEPLHLDLQPTLDRLSQLPERMLVYATVDAEGALHNFRIIQGADPGTDSTVLANLQAWEFLPAFRDGKPVEVEALFGIPLY